VGQNSFFCIFLNAFSNEVNMKTKVLIFVLGLFSVILFAGVTVKPSQSVRWNLPDELTQRDRKPIEKPIGIQPVRTPPDANFKERERMPPLPKDQGNDNKVKPLQKLS
jgi:hypothetical protein